MSSGSQFGGVPPGKLQNVRLARSEAGSHIAESKLAFKAWINLKLRVKTNTTVLFKMKVLSFSRMCLFVFSCCCLRNCMWVHV
jgi:hypothetical protein